MRDLPLYASEAKSGLEAIDIISHHACTSPGVCAGAQEGRTTDRVPTAAGYASLKPHSTDLGPSSSSSSRVRESMQLEQKRS